MVASLSHFKTFQEIGKWMDVNSSAIYGTTPMAPYQFGNVVFTVKKDTVYAIYLADEKETAMPGVITIKGWTPKPGSKATMPGTLKYLVWKAIQGNTEITIPAVLSKNPPSNFAWTNNLTIKPLSNSTTNSLLKALQTA